jgi:hypothetical protein
VFSVYEPSVLNVMFKNSFVYHLRKFEQCFYEGIPPHRLKEKSSNGGGKQQQHY